MIDIPKTIKALCKSEATPDQQREGASLLLLMKQLNDWQQAEAAYMTLMASGLLGRSRPKEE